MIRFLFLVLLFITIPWAATPSYNGASVQVSDFDGNATATTGTLTASAGSNRLLEVTVGVGAGSVVAHSGVTWGGVSLTQRGTSFDVGAGGHGRMSKWYLKEANFPGSATGTIVATLAGGQDEVWVVGVLYSDVDQTNPYKNVSMTTNTAANNNSATITVTSDANTLVTSTVWGVDIGGGLTSIAITAGTSRQEVDNLGGFNAEGGGAGDIAGGASNATMSWAYTMTSSNTMDDWGMVGDALQYQAGGGGGGASVPAGLLLRGGGR